MGTHEELLEKDGLYKKLYDMQFKYDPDEEEEEETPQPSPKGQRPPEMTRRAGAPSGRRGRGKGNKSPQDSSKDHS